MIRINNLHKYYNKGKKNEQHVLNDISLELDQTGLVCILGESGSGKTTLLNTIGGLDTFSTGTITIDETEIKKYDPKVIEPIRNDRFDYVFQNYYLLQDYSVSYNIKLALNRYDLTEEEKEERVDYVLRILGMEKYKKKLVSKLSGGQQQRVSIARALVKSPDVILADEPTGNLDEENTIRTMSILKNISRECLVLLVTHEKRIARFFADRIIEICDGKVVRDEVNHPSDSYERSDDSNIYLKEMTSESLDNEMASFRMYRDEKSLPQKIELTLAWRDNKLYIQNNMDCDILIEGVENGVQMLDEERPSLDMEEVDKFSYDLPKLESKGSAKLGGREIFKMAVENIQMMGRKQAFVIAILLVTAVLLCLTMAEFINTVSIDESAVVSTDTHYVQLDFTNYRTVSKEDLWQIMDFAQDYLKDDTYGDVFFMPNTNLYLTGSGYKQLNNMTQLMEKYSYTSTDHLKESDLVYGTMPKKRNDVVMDLQLIDRLSATKGSVTSLHHTAESYIGMRLKVTAMEVELHVVGISDTKQTTLYCGQNVLLGMTAKGYQIANVKELQAEDPENYKDVSLSDNEILVRKGLQDAMKNKEMTIGDDTEHVYKIVGTFSDDIGVDYILSDTGCVNVRNLMICEGKSCYIYSDNPDAAMQHFSKAGDNYSSIYRIDAKIPVKEQVKEYREEHTTDLDAKNLITLAIVLISLILVYFTIKSNAVSRSEELTVYRLIGISKGSIMKSYMLEMILITCYTSLPAVLVTSGVLHFINSIPSLEINMIFPWWSALILLVCIYAVHVLISILPVCGILSKPPATLAVKE